MFDVCKINGLCYKVHCSDIHIVYHYNLGTVYRVKVVQPRTHQFHSSIVRVAVTSQYKCSFGYITGRNQTVLSQENTFCVLSIFL
jgi:hypothetical protein